MPTGVRVGSSVACYEFICRMAQITAESQPPTLSVCLRAKGDLWVCFCLHLCYYDNTSISIHIYHVYQCPPNSRYLLFPFTLNFCTFSSCRSHLVLLVLYFFLYYPPPPHHPMLTSNSRDGPPLVICAPLFLHHPQEKLQYDPRRAYSAPITC